MSNMLNIIEWILVIILLLLCAKLALQFYGKDSDSKRQAIFFIVMIVMDVLMMVVLEVISNYF